ncbi:protein translocase subunit secF [Sinobacterium caligoides]|uniref:Protein-export membrane protein SecF n=1 Tax=Sinobacterium caligoides TaxID=933926 RepID=A0A3N2DZV7_9GAMM|nr:protein translocase subunit SecF [Sinobacterium caligoides]ROS05182.1 protein translocase subunit secF [Sinobacterium caligoides]
MSKQIKIIPFMSYRMVATILSTILVLGSIFSLATKGLNFGLDFTGGTQIEVYYEKAVPLGDIRQTLETKGYHGATVVNFGSDRDVLVRLAQGFDDKAGAHMIEVLAQDSGTGVELRRVEFVGPQVGEELREQGGLALLLALLVVMVYVAIRFQFKFAVGAVLALAHDVIIALGVFSVFYLNFDLTVLAALLALIGYSLNDTIVVYDRIRENFLKIRKGDACYVINVSLSEVLGRTIVTSGTTLLVLIALFYWGGDMIHGFATSLLVGITVGTYSSIYIAANILVRMKITREDLMPPVIKDERELDERP